MAEEAAPPPPKPKGDWLCAACETQNLQRHVLCSNSSCPTRARDWAVSDLAPEYWGLMSDVSPGIVRCNSCLFHFRANNKAAIAMHWYRNPALSRKPSWKMPVLCCRVSGDAVYKDLSVEKIRTLSLESDSVSAAELGPRPRTTSSASRSHGTLSRPGSRPGTSSIGARSERDKLSNVAEEEVKEGSFRLQDAIRPRTVSSTEEHAKEVSQSDADSQRPVTASTKLSQHAPRLQLRSPSLRRRLETPLRGWRPKPTDEDEGGREERHHVTQTVRHGKRAALVMEKRPAFMEFSRANAMLEHEDDDDDVLAVGTLRRAETAYTDAFAHRKSGYRPVESGAFNPGVFSSAFVGGLDGRRQTAAPRGTVFAGPPLQEGALRLDGARAGRRTRVVPQR